MKQIYKILLSVVLLLAMVSVANASRETKTGCISASKGILYNVQQGTSPSGICNKGE